eukprot:m.261829 g.261829  ORF g.261829 m.261829 type:complete len:123 (+) comp40449_c1_seq46:730-1098(+)
MDGTTNGVRMKSQRGREGPVQGIVCRNISMKGVGSAVFLTLNYHSGLPKTTDTATPRFDDVLIENLVAKDCSVGLYFDGLPESAMKGIRLVNVDVQAKKMLAKCDYVEGSCSNCSYCHSCFN